MKRCPSCGIEKPRSEWSKNRGRHDGLGNYCKECSAKILREYRKTSEWKKWRRQYYQENAERECENARNSQKRHSENVASRNRDYHQRRKHHRNELSRQWRLENPEKFKASAHRRRAREYGNGDHFTADEWQALCEFYENKCLRCGKCEPEIKLTPDHVVSLAKGGSNTIDNIQPLCLSCNKRKGSIRTTDYRNTDRRKHVH